MTYFTANLTLIEELIRAERAAQDAKWGPQNHPDGTNHFTYATTARDWKYIVDAAAKQEKLTWRHILQEEVYEAFAEEDPAKLRAELVQVAAVAVAWIEAIDRRQQAKPEETPVYPAPGSEIPGQPGYVVGKCGHRIASSEWQAGFRTCERCPSNEDQP